MELTTQAAYQAGIDGKPEPARVTKHVQIRDAATGELLTGQVETESSLRNRLAWERGVNGPFGLFERWISGRLESLEQRVTAMNARCNSEWLEHGDSGYGLLPSNVTPESIHGVSK